jgi:hypothetical protein
LAAVYELPEPEIVVFQEFTTLIAPVNRRPTDQPLTAELTSFLTVKLAVKPLPQLLTSPTEQLTPLPLDALDELRLEEVLLNELRVEELLLDKLLLELVAPDLLVISPADAVRVTLSNPAPSSRLSKNKV